MGKEIKTPKSVKMETKNSSPPAGSRTIKKTWNYSGNTNELPSCTDTTVTHLSQHSGLVTSRDSSVKSHQSVSEQQKHLIKSLSPPTGFPFNCFLISSSFDWDANMELCAVSKLLSFQCAWQKQGNFRIPFQAGSAAETPHHLQPIPFHSH